MNLPQLQIDLFIDEFLERSNIWKMRKILVKTLWFKEKEFQLILRTIYPKDSFSVSKNLIMSKSLQNAKSLLYNCTNSSHDFNKLQDRLKMKLRTDLIKCLNMPSAKLKESQPIEKLRGRIGLRWLSLSENPEFL